MRTDRAEDQAGGKNAPQNDETWPHEQHHCDQLEDARPDPAPWLGPEHLEDVDRLHSAGEFEEQGLTENHCDNHLTDPTNKRHASSHLRALGYGGVTGIGGWSLIIHGPGLPCWCSEDLNSGRHPGGE
jgi:hypothetical protein